MNDSTLTTLTGGVPACCILFLEDLDAVFTRSTTRDSISTGAPSTKKKSGKSNDDEDNSSQNKRKKDTSQ
jgi:chaperone BCS1